MTDERDEELRLVLLKLGRRIRANRAGDLTDPQLSVLVHLETTGDLTPGRLSELEHVSPPSMNRTVNALEDAAWVVRSRSGDDARNVLVTITPAGREIVRETRRLRTAWLAGRLGDLDPAERRLIDAAVPVLRRLADS